LCSPMSKPTPPEVFGPAEFAQATHVSHETGAQLETYAEMLRVWNRRHNLVSEASLEDVWHRHMLDSAQLIPLIPESTKTLADIGSGAGFPGLVLAIMLRNRIKVTLYEATRKKCEFLAAVAERLVLKNLQVRNERVEAAPRELFDVVTARACAPLPRLLEYAQDFIGPDTVCLFLKGQNLVLELTDARKSWRMKVRQHQSITHPYGAVLEIRDLAHGSRRTD
jgi:16S rRNA (guanine527-N7)-methyltransferase